MIRIKPLAISLLISLGVGAASSWLTRDAFAAYGREVTQPSFAPPAMLFPIVWTILFFLMGISAYMIYETGSSGRATALKLYAVQLAINFVWPLIFFLARRYLAAFFWILLLWMAVAAMISEFYKVKPAAALLQVPYLLWISFASVLNLSVYFLNR